MKNSSRIVVDILVEVPMILAAQDQEGNGDHASYMRQRLVEAHLACLTLPQSLPHAEKNACRELVSRAAGQTLLVMQYNYRVYMMQ